MKFESLVKLPMKVAKAKEGKCLGCKHKFKTGDTACMVNDKMLCFQCAFGLLSAYRYALIRIEEEMFGRGSA